MNNIDNFVQEVALTIPSKLKEQLGNTKCPEMIDYKLSFKLNDETELDNLCSKLLGLFQKSGNRQTGFYYVPIFTSILFDKADEISLLVTEDYLDYATEGE